MREALSSATVDLVNEGKTTARAAYRRRIQQRQTIIFGSISAILAVLLLLSLLFWTGVLPFPFDREFTPAKSSNTVVTPCIEEGTAAVELNSISVNVYNSTSRANLASQAATDLAGRGVVVNETGNWDGQSLSESARIITGPEGIAAAYTIAQYFPDSMIQYNNGITDATLNIVLGSDYESLETPENVAAANPEGTLSPAENCTVVGASGTATATE
ncbi:MULTISPECIES: LytR C-terminal domain-containing protein [unclassified Actinobaculum]|uniref:LytR C-terminal domain-containing protein n=1 Tax=unclassified Actinobaculum TaxID=2609299 RepID=UPI000D528AD4|nr:MULTISPECIES: LytR C-terminal domain-containing protein [unclassified Actinobaculum]AWE41635.1 hypothetical protein DDD63_01395 [Actinobaculum sp. 313]RTE49257.1 LytR family transcriptional regulator [Actinobaculum sp. 352]